MMVEESFPGKQLVHKQQMDKPHTDEESTDEPLWGESDGNSHKLPPTWGKDVMNDIDSKVIMNSIDSLAFKNYFYGEETGYSSTRKERDVIAVNDVIKRTCKMVKYRNDLKEAVEKGRFQHDAFNMDQLGTNIPEIGSKNNGSIQLYKYESSDFVEGIFPEPIPNITCESTLDALRSCVSTILAFRGFSSTTMAPLQVLTEIAEDYIKRMAKLLHINAEKELLEGEEGFSDAVDRTCHEMGIGSVRSLAQHYKEETLPFSRRRMKECKEEIAVHEETLRKRRDEKRQTSELSFVEVNEEDLVIPELHLTSISGSDMSSKPFDVGLQIIKSLDRQQLINLDLSKQPSCSSSLITVDLSCVKNEFEDVKPPKRRRK